MITKIKLINDEEEKEFNELEFQKTYKEMAIKQGLSLDPDDPKHFYDYRALYKETGKLEPDKTGHFPSKYKLEGHPNMVIGGINTKTGKPIKGEKEKEELFKIAKIKPITGPIETQFSIGAKAMDVSPVEPEEPIDFGIQGPMTEDFSLPINRIKYYKSKIDWLEGIAEKKGGLGESGYDAYRYSIEQYNKAVKEYNKELKEIEEAPEIKKPEISAKPKEESKPLFKDPKMIELQKINFKSMQLWFKGLKESKNKWAFLRGEGQPPELEELHRQRSELAPYMNEKSKQWIQTTALAAYGVGLAGELIPIVAKATPEMIRKILYKTEIKDVSKKELHTALYNVTKGTDTPEQRKIFDIFIRAKEIGVPFAERLKGVKIPIVTPRFAFAGKLYAGLPVDEIVKSIVEVGKVTASAVKGLDPVKVSQVTQQLLNINPALANEFLKAVEKPVKIPEVKEEIPSVKPEIKEEISKVEPITPKGEVVPELKKVITEEEKEFLKAEKEYPAKIVKEEVEELKPLATPKQIKKAHAIANSKAMISDKGKMKPQYRELAKVFTDQKSIKKMTKEEAEIFIDMLNRLPEPKLRNGKLVAPSIPRTMKLTTEGFFQKKYGEPTPIWLLTDQTYYATKLGIKPLVEPFEKGKMEFDLEFRKSSNLVDRMVVKLNKIAKTSGWERIKSKVKNIPTKAESKMAELINKHETTPSGLSEKEEDVFKYFRNLSKDIWRRENEVREKVDLPPIKYKTAYFRHTADAMAKEMLEGKYPFPQGIKYWSEKMVGKKIFNPMEFQRKLSDDLVDLWSKDIRAVTKAMLWNGLKEIYLAQPAKFLNEQLNAISKDLPEYKNLTPREQAAYDQTRVMPASTKKWLINYINQVIKGQETELDASLNRIITKSGLRGMFDKVLSPFGRSIGRKPITNTFQLAGRAIISGVMGWVPRQITRNSFQPVQNLALYGVKATIKAYLPASVDKNLKELLSESLFLKSYTGFEELPTNLMAKLEKVWLGPYGIVAVNNAKLGMKAAYWNILELIKNPKFKKYNWADPQRTKDTPKGYLFPSEKEKLLKEMEFGSSCTQYQYIPIGMPGIFRYKALIPLTRLQSWWMNYFAKFNREAIHRALKGKPSWSGEDGPTLPWSRRVNWLKYLVIGGAVLTAMGYRRSFLIGVLPTYLSPAGQVALGFYNYATATEDWQKKRALKQIYYSWKAFIPGSLAWKDFLAVWNGEKDLEEILFYGKKEEKKPEAITIGKPSISKISIPKINKIKINKISPVKIKF